MPEQDPDDANVDPCYRRNQTDHIGNS
jgi:hypothetical protein